MGKEPDNIYLTPALAVRLEWNTENPRRAGDDEGSVGEFLQWQIDNKVFTLRGYGCVGSGIFSGIFRAEDGPKVEGWLREKGFIE